MARCSLEVSDSSRVRFQTIAQVIAECQFGIHDLSRTELDPVSALPRFNMPLELGLFLGAKEYGTGAQRRKNCLILDRERYRYAKFCSDISGQDIAAHNGLPAEAIRRVRDWLRTALAPRGVSIPGGTAMANRFVEFQHDVPESCRKLRLDEHALVFTDLRVLIAEWLATHP